MFDVYRQYFADCDIYVGINGNPCPEYISYLQEQQKIFNLKYVIVPKELEVHTDVSAYQAALKLVKEDRKEYGYVWFAHTKGITNESESSQHRRRVLLNEFISERSKITNLLQASNAGTYSLYLAKYAGKKEFDDILLQYFKFNKPYFYTYLYLYTFYVIKGKYLHNFLNNCATTFFTNNLIKNGADIYMFERDFPQIAWRQGGYPLFKYWDTIHILGGCYTENHYYEDISKYYA